MRFLFPSSPATFDQAFEAFRTEQTRGDTGEKWMHTGNDWYGMRKALYKLGEINSDWRLEILADLVMPQARDPEMFSYSWGPHVDSYEYARRLEGHLRCGFVAFADMRYQPSETGEWVLGETGLAGRTSIDHFVLLDGVRSGWRKRPQVEGRAFVYQIHVVCSAAGGRSYWIDVDDLLRKHGTGGWWLARPRTDEEIE